MHRRTLHCNIALACGSFTPIVQLHDYLSFQHNTIIQTLCAVHHGLVVGREIDNADDSAFGLTMFNLPAVFTSSCNLMSFSLLRSGGNSEVV
jgi:hypothetical protein